MEKDINTSGFARMLDEASEEIGEVKSTNNSNLRDELLNENKEYLPQDEIDALLKIVSEKENEKEVLLPVPYEEIEEYDDSINDIVTKAISETVNNENYKQFQVYKIYELGVEIELMNADRAGKEEKDVSIMGKISRTTDSLHDIKDNTYKDRSNKYREFNEKWYSEMHHSSLGEHAIIKLWFNGVDIATAKLLEKGIFGVSPTERSTRYFIEYTKRIDENLEGEALYDILKELYVLHPSMDWHSGEECIEYKNKYYRYLRKATNNFIDVKEKAQEYIEKILPENKAKSKYLDIARQYLLTSSRTSVVITYNAVSLKNTIMNLARGTENQRILANHLHRMMIVFYPSLFSNLNLDNYLTYEKNTIFRMLYNNASDDDYFLEMAKFNPNFGIIKKDLTDKNLWDNFSPRISSEKPTFKIEQVDIYKDCDMDLCLNLMDLYSAKNEFIGSDNEYFRGLQYPVRVVGKCYIDYGTWRDIQRHRISNNIYNDYNTPLLAIDNHNTSYDAVYIIPNIELLDKRIEDSVIDNAFNGKRENYEVFKEEMESYLSLKLENIVNVYKTFLTDYSNHLIHLHNTDDYDKDSIIICNNIKMIEMSSDLNLLAHRIIAIMNLDLRAIKHIVENRIISAGHNSYRLFAVSMFENTIHYIIPRMIEKEVLSFGNRDRFVRTLFKRLFTFDYYRNIIDKVKNI